MIKQAILITIFGLTTAFAYVASLSVDNSTSDLKILGTSTIHDWKIDAEEVAGTAQLEAADELKISDLDFWVNVKSLESGKGAMNRNTYEALNADKYPKIKYKLTDVVSQSKTTTGYKLNTKGNLTIAGKTKSITMPVEALKRGGDISFKGEITFKMTDFEIDPPTAVFGTIKTGDEVEIKFNIHYKN